MAFSGADTTALITLAGHFGRAADELDQVVGSVGSTVASTRWTGADSARFRASWDSDAVRALRAASDALRDAGRRLVAEAREQDQASAADGGTIGGGAVGGGSSATGGVGGGAFGAFDRATPGGFANLAWLAAGVGADVADDLLGVADNAVGVGHVLGAASAAVHLGDAATALMNDDPLGYVTSMLGATSDALKMAPPTSPVFWAGSALGIWTYVGEQAIAADFPNTWGPTMEYIHSNPMDALGGAIDGVNQSWTSILGAVS